MSRCILLIVLFASLIGHAQQPTQTPKTTHLIRNVRIVDGSGAASFYGAVRIYQNRIVAVGQLKEATTDTIIEGENMVLSPGFIDTHSHHFGSIEKDPASLATNSQGITTIVVGQDGISSPIDSIRAFIYHTPVAVNIATYTGQTSLREKAMKNDVLRQASRKEIKQMKRDLSREMKKGSLGLSTGLEYEEAFYSSYQEVLQLASKAAEFGGRYISHIRSEDVAIEEALQEIINIGRDTRMPVQISHIKIGMKDKWGKSTELIKALNGARAEGVNITADLYPYTFWNSTLRVLFPKRDYNNIQSASFAVEQLLDPKTSVLVRFSPNENYQGKTISTIAAIRKETEARSLIALIDSADNYHKTHPGAKGSIEAVAGQSMCDEDVDQFMAWPFTNICSDGRAGGHPRGYGAFTRVLGFYVREKKVLSLESAIHKMTAMGAAHTGIGQRGLIKEGFYADLVLFDPATVNDRSTLENATGISDGIVAVWINGQITYVNKRATGKLPGGLIKKSHN